MKRNILLIIGGIMLSTIFFSCKNDVVDLVNPLDGLIKIKEGYAIGASAKIEIWGTKNFFTGYNNLKVVLYDSLNPTSKITDAHITFLPVMTMGMGSMSMQHSSPVENPDAIAVNGVFPAAIAFIMGTATDAYWNLSVGVHNHKYDKEGVANFDITVDNPINSSLTVFKSQTADSTKLVLALVQPSIPKVGLNDIEFTIHRMASMMDFPADDSYAIEITPIMPSMGHGSPNNINPVNSGNGHYKGKVNFTMTGDWRINVIIKKNGAIIKNNAFFNITL